MQQNNYHFWIFLLMLHSSAPPMVPFAERRSLLFPDFGLFMSECASNMDAKKKLVRACKQRIDSCF